MSAPTVVMHRPPRPRIDLNPVRKAAAGDAGAGFSYSPAECARIWTLLGQSAEGCNQVEASEP